MARNIHWKVSFRTRSEKLGVLNLYEENYYGAVVELTPAAVPFETQEDSSDTWFVPIRKQTGYIRVLDEGNTDGIMPVGLKDRYVEYKENGSLKWCGYMVPDVFSSDWGATPLEVEFPVVGGLGVLEGIYLNEDDGLGVVPLARLLYDALNATGVNYSTIYFPMEVLQNESATDYLFPMRVEVSRFNFFAENDSLNSEDSDWLRYNGSTHYEVLSELMAFWGWTIRERGDQVWITSTVNTGSVWITFSELEMLARGSSSVAGSRSTDINMYDLSSLGLAGDDHKRDILQGRKKITVKAGVNPVGTVVPSVDKSKMKAVYTTAGSLEVNGYVYGYEKLKQFTPKDGYTDVVFRSFAKSTPFEIFDGWKEVSNVVADPEHPEFYSINLYVGGYFTERERVSAEEYANKKNWNLSECIMLRLDSWDYLYPDASALAGMKFVEMRSRRIANYESGAFVISASTKDLYQTAGFQTQEGNGAGEVEVMFRVGDKYWGGDSWVTVPSWFFVATGDETNANNLEGQGKIISTKTLEMPYNGADGYVMPITEYLSGEVEMSIRRVNHKRDVSFFFILENLKVDYFAEERDEAQSDDSENRYAKKTGRNYTNEEVLSIKMATDNNNKAGYGILSRYGQNVESMYFKGKGMLRPELNLVNKGVSLYGRNTEKLTLQLDKIIAKPHDVIVWRGGNYLLVSEAVNWQEGTGVYIIMGVK